MWLCTLRPFPIFSMIFANDMFLFVFWYGFCSCLFVFVRVYMYSSLSALKKNIGRPWICQYHSRLSNTIYFSTATKVFSQSDMFFSSILLYKQYWLELPLHFSPLYPSSQMHLKPFSVSTQVAWWEQGLGLQKFWSKDVKRILSP